MTISLEKVKTNLYTSNGVQDSFPFNFYCTHANNVKLYTWNGSTEVNYIKDVDYNISLNTNQSTTPGGTISFVLAPPSGYKLRITSNADSVQTYDISTQNAYNALALETAIDKLTLSINEIRDKLSRVPTLPMIHDGLSMAIPANEALANKALGFDENGNFGLATVSEDAFVGDYFNDPTFIGTVTTDDVTIGDSLTVGGLSTFNGASVFSGTINVPNQAVTDNDQSAANTAFVQNNSGSYNGFVNYTTSTVLTSSDINKLISINSATPVTIQLPSITGLKLTSTLYIVNRGAGDVTLTAAAGQSVVHLGIGANTRPLRYKDDVFLSNVDTTTWHITGGALATTRNASPSTSDNSKTTATTEFVQALIATLPQSGVVVDTVAALRLNTATASQALVKGYYAVNGGGGGLYYYDVTDTTSTDNGASVIVDASLRRWKPIIGNGAISANRCGVKAEVGFNNSALLQTAIDNFQKVIFEKSTTDYEFTARVTIPAGKWVDGNGAKLKKTNGDYLFETRGDSTRISNMIFTASTGANTGFCVQRTDLSGMQYSRIEEITTYYCYHFLIDTAGANFAVNTQLYKISCRLHRGYGILLTKNFAYLYITIMGVDYVGSDVHNSIAYSLTGNEGAFLTQCDVTGGVVDATNPNAHGFAFQSCKAIWFSKCMADTVGGHGFYGVSGNQYIYFDDNCVSSLCGGHGFLFAGGSDYFMKSGFAVGRSGLGYAPSANGLRADNVTNVFVGNFVSRSFVGDGVFVNASSGNWTGGRSYNNTSRGFNSSGTNTWLNVGITFANNGVGNISHSSANIHTTACQQGTGALLSLSGSGTA